MNRKNLGIMLFVLLVLWTMMIFYFSSQSPNVSHSQSGMVVSMIRKANDILYITDTRTYKKVEYMVTDILFMGRYKTTNGVVRKSAHFGIYFILGSICSSFGYMYSKKLLMGLLLGISLPVTIAVLDEFNQGLVGRTSSLNDVIIDGVGAFIGTVLVIASILIIRGIVLLKKR